MSTGLLAALYAVVLTTAFAASRIRPLAGPVRRRWPWAIHRLVGLISLLGAAVLLVIGDIHGGAATIGAVLGLVFARTRQSIQSAPS